MSEQFEAFAASSGIGYTAEPLGLAPRDLTARYEEAELLHLVTLTRTGADASVRVAFAKPLTNAAPPSAGEVLWWLAGDAFALEQSEDILEPWAHAYGLPPDAAGTALLFEQQRRQCEALRGLLGDVGYRRLIAIYESHMVGSQ